MLIIGIDPGISGAICFMEDGKMVGLLPGDEGYEDH